jgi:hypothetical protein
MKQNKTEKIITALLSFPNIKKAAKNIGLSKVQFINI